MGYGASVSLNWRDVNANFNDANSAMGNALRGISQAGTVFGELRKSILDEEQRAIDNAYKQQVFDENVRQFGEKQALDRAKFAEDSRRFGLNYALDQAKLAENIRSNQATEAYRANELAARNTSNRIAQEKWNLEQQDRQAAKDVYNLLTGDYQDAQRVFSDLQTRINNETNPEAKLKLQQQLANEKLARQSVATETAADATARRLLAGRGIFNVNNTPFTAGANLETQRSMKGMERNVQKEKDLTAANQRAVEYIGKLNLSQDDSRWLSAATSDLSTKYKLNPDIVAQELANLRGGTLGEWFSGKNTFSDNSYGGIHLSSGNYTPSEALDAHFAAMKLRTDRNSRDTLNMVNAGSSNSSSDSSGSSSSPTSFNPRKLSDAGLDYSISEKEAELAQVRKEVADSPELVQQRYKTLYKQVHGSLPESKVSDAEKKLLRQKAEEDLINSRSKQIQKQLNALNREQLERIVPDEYNDFESL